MSLSTEPQAMAAPRVRAVTIRPLLALWVGLVAAASVFLAVGSVRIGAGSWAGLRMSVRRIWDHFTQFLMEQGASGALVSVVTAAAILALAGAGAVLWLAFDMKDADSEPPEGAAGQ